MQPRILIKQEGQKKKRFISPTEIKNNQLVYGDPVGSSKIINIPHPNVPISQRVYSPNSGSHKSITQIEKQQQLNKIKTIQINKNTVDSGLNDSKLSSEVSKQSIIQKSPKIENNQYSSRSKSGKKDYMMSHLSKLNKKPSKNYETESNSSQSRSKIGSIRSIEKNKELLQYQNEEEYPTVKTNVYNQKQNGINTRERNTGTVQMEIVNFDKKQEEVMAINSVEQNKIIVKKPSIQISQVKPEQKIKSFIQEEKKSSKSNFQKLPLKNSVNSDVKQIQQFNRFQKHQQDSQNSVLAFHLKKAHEEKEQLREKKIQVQRERNEYKQRFQSQQQEILHLRKEIQRFQVQNLLQNSQLKSIRQAQTFTKQQLHNTNARNQHLYRQLHEKYTSILKEYKQYIQINQQLKQRIQEKQIQNLNLLKRNQFNEERMGRLEQNKQKQRNQYMNQLEKNTFEWMERLEKVQRELRKYKEMQQNGGINRESKIRVSQIKKQLQVKDTLLQKKEDEIKRIQKQMQIKVTNLQRVLIQKEKQIQHLYKELKKQQNKFTQKILQSQNLIKNLQLAIAKYQKQIQLKNNQVSQTQTKIHQLTINSHIQELYSNNSLPDSKTNEAKSTLELIVTTQFQSINQSKKLLNNKIEENFNLQSQNQQLRSENNKIFQQLQIMKLQFSALTKKHEQSYTTELQILKSQLDIASRRQKELQQKLDIKINEVKQKQQFIQSFLVNQKN